MEGFDLRGLEIHNSRMWRWASVENALDLMEKLGLNALIFHQSDMIDQLVLPSAFFNDETSWQRWPIRLAMTSTHREYIYRVIERARSRGIQFYLEVKELWYPDALLELLPRLRTPQGSVCPTDPFWMELLSIKLRELLQILPDLAGLIVSPATRESKVTIANSSCACERCRNTDPSDWYEKLIRTMHFALAERGMTLVIRDFAYTVEQQDLVLNAAAAVSGDIVAALKCVPHDFWLTFPDNPRIGNVHGLRQWIEYDVWGQYCGLGVFPVSLVADLRRQLRSSREKGATGVWFRTDWEIVDEASVFNSFNLLNLVAGAIIARDPGTDPDAAYAAWLDFGLRSPLRPESSNQVPVRPTAPDAVWRLKAFMEASRRIIEKTLYLRGHVFQYSSRFHHSLAEVENIMFKHQGREKWDPQSAAFVVLNEANARIILEEKQAACREVEALEAILDPRTLGVPADFAEEMHDLLDLYRYYVQGFTRIAAAYLAARSVSEGGNDGAKQAARREARALSEFRASLESRLAGTRYPFYVYWMLDTRELALLEADM